MVRRETFVKGRGNVLIEYPCSKKDAPYVSFVGCHMDVVPANPDDWDCKPFELSINGDELRGRGVTDCLGHVALVTELFRHMAGIQLTHVPYKGASVAANDLVGGHLNLMFDAFSSSFPNVQAGRLRALGVSTRKRFPMSCEGAE